MLQETQLIRAMPDEDLLVVLLDTVTHHDYVFNPLCVLEIVDKSKI